MKKNLLFFGTLMSAFLLASCPGGSKNRAPATSMAGIENATEVVKYYNTSFGALEDMVKERDANAVLSYMEQKGKVSALTVAAPPTIVARDSATTMNPEDYFNGETRQNPTQNYAGLFKTRAEFYAGLNTYLPYLKKKDVTKAKQLLEANCQLNTQIPEYKQNAFDILSSFTEQAEQVFLANSPLKEQIISVRKISATMQSILNLYARKHMMDGPRIDLRVAELTKQLDSAEKLPTVNSHESEMKSYQTSLSRVEVSIKQVQKAREKGEYNDADYDVLTSAHETLIIQKYRMNTMFFGGICNLCNGTVSFIVKRDKKKSFRFVSLQPEADKTLLGQYAVESSNKTLYYFWKGDCYSKSMAILHVLKDLGGFWQCFYLLILILVKVRDALYLLVSKYWYRISGKVDSCTKPASLSDEEFKRLDQS